MKFVDEKHVLDVEEMQRLDEEIMWLAPGFYFGTIQPQSMISRMKAIVESVDFVDDEMEYVYNACILGKRPPSTAISVIEPHIKKILSFEYVTYQVLCKASPELTLVILQEHGDVFVLISEILARINTERAVFDNLITQGGDMSKNLTEKGLKLLDDIERKSLSWFVGYLLWWKLRSKNLLDDKYRLLGIRLFNKSETKKLMDLTRFVAGAGINLAAIERHFKKNLYTGHQHQKDLIDLYNELSRDVLGIDTSRF
jgi:hypothetical protein